MCHEVARSEIPETPRLEYLTAELRSTADMGSMSPVSTRRAFELQRVNPLNIAFDNTLGYVSRPKVIKTYSKKGISLLTPESHVSGVAPGQQSEDSKHKGESLNAAVTSPILATSSDRNESLKTVLPSDKYKTSSIRRGRSPKVWEKPPKRLVTGCESIREGKQYAKNKKCGIKMPAKELLSVDKIEVTPVTTEVRSGIDY